MNDCSDDTYLLIYPLILEVMRSVPTMQTLFFSGFVLLFGLFPLLNDESNSSAADLLGFFLLKEEFNAID